MLNKLVVALLMVVACNAQSVGTIQAITNDPLAIIVDAEKKIEELVKAGRYDWADRAINQVSFPVEAGAKRDEVMMLVRFSRGVSSDEAVEQLRITKLRPANLIECLAYGAGTQIKTIRGFTKPQYRIVCLGQSVYIGRKLKVPALLLGEEDRDLTLAWWEFDWSTGDYFLAVRD